MAYRGSTSICCSTDSSLYHSWLKHLLSRCLPQEEKMSSTFKLCGAFFSQPLSLSLSLCPSLTLSVSLNLTNVVFFVNSPHLSLLTSYFQSFSVLLFHALIVYTALYYTQAAGSEGEVKEMKHHLVAETQGNLFTSLHYATPSHMGSPRSI